MARVDRGRALESFRAYVAPYGESSQRIALKVEHTYRVAEICERIARAEAWSEDDVDLAWLCGLLHDIGRFEQIRLWDTFRDADSASHALIGTAVLGGGAVSDVPAAAPVLECEDGALGIMRASHPSAPLPGSGHIASFLDDRDADNLIIASVGQHSALKLDGALDDRTRAFCSLVRDADKIDILRVNCENTPYTVLGLSDEEFLQSKISDTAMQAFRERRCLSREERREPADLLVGMLAFVFELVYPQSMRLVREQGYLARLLDRPLGLTRSFALEETRERWDELAGLLKAMV